MSRSNNARTLDAIADDINKLERANIFDIGGLLIEAKGQCEHGQWLPWLETEFAWSADTAERYMNVARLGEKFRSVRNLKLAATTLYALADGDYYSDDFLPTIIHELGKHATKKRLTHKDAERVIDRVVTVKVGRIKHGDYPDATLVKLQDLSQTCNEPWLSEAVDALKTKRPETDDAADAIVRQIEEQHWEAEEERWQAARDAEAEERRELAKRNQQADQEVDAILDGPAPVLPPPITPPEPQKFEPETDWDTLGFDDSVIELLRLHTKPVGRFVGKCTPEALRKVANFLMDIAVATETADKAEAA